MTAPIRRVLVVVPARNEEQLVGRCLASVTESQDRLAATRPEIAVRVVLAADRCTDRTVEVAECFRARGVSVLLSTAGRVGAARALGIELLLGDESGGRDEAHLDTVWIANTDADSAVPANWLEHQVALAEAGADVMVGTVRPDPRDLTVAEDRAWRGTHPRGQANGHVHGANLGLRASVYLDAGGFDDVAEHEDNLLVDRVRGVARIVASDEAEVLTSGRFVGRTPGGYAEHLHQSLSQAQRDAGAGAGVEHADVDRADAVTDDLRSEVAS